MEFDRFVMLRELFTNMKRHITGLDPTVQQYAIKVTKRGPSTSPVDPGWEPLA